MITILILLTWISLFSTGFSRSDGKKKISLRKPDIVDLIFVNYNNWSYVKRNNGSYMYDSPDQDDNGNNAGGEFPRGSHVTIVYAGGIYIGTLKDGIPVVSETEFATEFQPGRITNSGVPFGELKAEDPESPLQQVYLIDRSQSGDDYQNWPPEALRNSKGFPALIADAQTWAVFNDIDTSLNSESVSESPNPGLGMQITLESFVTDLPFLRDAVYFKWTIQNRSNSDYINSYVGLWMDADVNDSSNDIVGVDTSRSLGFTYNNDNETPDDRAVGVDLLQGPVVHINDIPAKYALKFQNNTTKLEFDESKGFYRLQNLDPDYITLGLTAFSTYGGGTDPIDNEERLNMLRGAAKSTGTLKFGCGLDDYFAYRGNPLTGQGTCDVAGMNNPMGGLYSVAADQRQVLSIGPFTFRSGETQEIWAAVIGANGTDRLDAVSNLFKTDDAIQQSFDHSLFPQYTPAVPQISASALDRKVVLTWQNNAELSEDLTGELTGISTANGYSADYIKNDFQGYRVYRSLTGLEGSFELLAQYDKVDEFGYVTDRWINIRGTLEMNEIHVGDNTGLRYSYMDTDVINGQNYFYSVTAFDAQPYIGGPDSVFFDGYPIPKPLGLPISMESPIIANTISAVPQNNLSSIGSEARIDSAGVLHTSGLSDGILEVEVIDPINVTGGNYTVRFYELPDSIDGKDVVYLGSAQAGQLVFEIERDGNTIAFSTKVDDKKTWIDGGNGVLDVDGSGNLINGDEIFDDRLFSTSIAIPGTPSMEQFDICEGVLVKAFGPPLQVKSWNYTGGNGTAERWFTGIDFGLEQFFGGLSIGVNFLGATIADDAYRDVDIVFSTDTTGWSLIYGHVGAYGLQNETIVAPFKIFEVDPTDGNATPVEVNAMMRDQNNRNAWLLDNTLGGDGSGPQIRPYFHITNRPYDAGAQDAVLWGHSVDETPTMFSMNFSPRNQAALDWNQLALDAVGAGSDGGSVITAAERSSIYSQIPDDGTFHIYANHVITANDVFTYSTTARTVASKSDVKRALKDIKVVPNPFYKYSSYETSFDKMIKFTNLPDVCTIKIFTVAGDLVKTIKHNSTSNNNRVNSNPYDEDFEPDASSTSIEQWDLKTANGRYVASGMYIALIESPAGKRFVKFAVIQ